MASQLGDNQHLMCLYDVLSFADDQNI